MQTLEEELDQKTNHRSLVKAKTGETSAVEVEKMESELFGAKRAPFVKVKGLITRLINRLQTERSPVSYCNEETSLGAEEDLDADTAKHSSTLVSRSTTQDGEISTPQSEVSALSNRRLQTDAMRADFAIDHETVARGVVSNIRFDYLIDDFSSVDSKGLNHQDCEVPSHVGKQSGSMHQHQHNHHKQEQRTEQALQEGERNQREEAEKGQEERERDERRRRKEGKLRKKGTKRSRRT